MKRTLGTKIEMFEAFLKDRNVLGIFKAGLMEAQDIEIADLVIVSDYEVLISAAFDWETEDSSVDWREINDDWYFLIKGGDDD